MLTLARVIGAVFLALIVLLLYISTATNTSQAAPGGGSTVGPEKLYFGVETCVACHYDRKVQARNPICECTEAKEWREKDKHSDAWLNLHSERGQRMGRLLKLKDLDKKEYVSWDIIIFDNRPHVKALKKEAEKPINSVVNDPRCIGCHAQPDNPQYRPKLGDTFMVEQGVNCCVCHGSYRNWIKAHCDPSDPANAEWRAISAGDGKTAREIKEQKYGMKDLWDPAKRAELCLSCHLGNTEDEHAPKFVTHEMYAVGHPPLPSIEVGTFSALMPRHWQSLSAKHKKFDELLKKDEEARKQQQHYTFDADEARFEQTQMVLLAGVAVLEQSLKLVETQAKAAANQNDADKRALDWALFDCYACHHELGGARWRQQRYTGRPGRPTLLLQGWPMALARVALQSLDGRQANELQEKLTPLLDLFDKQAFGGTDFALITEKAGVAIKFTKGIADELQKRRKIDEATAKIVLENLRSLKDNESPDYDSARQIAWAIETIYTEVTGGEYGKVPGFEPLTEWMHLTLPATRSGSLEKDMDLVRKARAGYDPDKFKKLASELPKLPNK